MQPPNPSPISTLPPELLHCYTSTTTLQDILHLAATNRHHRQIRTHNTNTIYHHVSPRCIECHWHARVLLNDQRGTPVDSVSTEQDVLQIVRNAVIIERSVQGFNNTWVAHLANRQKNAHPSHYKYFNGIPRPPYLIPRERIRFIRALYHLWSRVLLDGPAKHNRILSLIAKDLFTIIDITFRDEHMLLDKAVMQKLDKTSLWGDLLPYRMRLVEEKLAPPGGYREYSLDVGYMGRVSIWEDTVEDFREVVTLRHGGFECPVEKVWYETDPEGGGEREVLVG